MQIFCLGNCFWLLLKKIQNLLVTLFVYLYLRSMSQRINVQNYARNINLQMELLFLAFLSISRNALFSFTALSNNILLYGFTFLAGNLEWLLQAANHSLRLQAKVTAYQNVTLGQLLVYSNTSVKYLPTKNALAYREAI